MLNSLQEKQFAAMQNNEDYIEIGAEITTAYFNEVDKKEFAVKAVTFEDSRYESVLTGVSYLAQPLEFYAAHKEAIIKFCFLYKQVNHRTLVEFVLDLTNTRSPHHHATIDDVAKVVYGDWQFNEDYENIVKAIVMFIAEVLAECFFDISENLEGEPMILHIDTVNSYIDNIGDTSKSNSFELCEILVRDFLSDIDYEEFGETTLSFSDSRIDGSEIIEGTVYHPNPVEFFTTHSVDIASWLNRFVVMSSSETVLDCVHCLMAEVGYTVDIDDIGKILYGKDTANKNYARVAKRVVGCFAESIASTYVGFVQSKCA